jgi:hypothetical protein
MDYVTEQGVKLRTGYHDNIDWYFLVIKEKLDNAIDFMWRNYPGVTSASVNVKVTIDKDRQNFVCTVSNTNSNNVPVFQNLDKILSFDMRYGSKQNEHIISRGMLGDAMKQIATFPYVLMHLGASGENIAAEERTAFSPKQWDKPMTIKANGVSKEIMIHVDKASQIIKPIIRETVLKSGDTNTEVSSTLPVVEDTGEYVLNRLYIDRIEKYCRRYAALTTDISFNFELTDYSKEEKEKQSYSFKVPALHSIPTKWNNTSSIHSYTPSEFAAKIMGVEDKEGIAVYDVLRSFKEGTQLKKCPDLEMTITEFIHSQFRAEKLEALYNQLKERLKPQEKISLPYSHISNKELRSSTSSISTHSVPAYISYRWTIFVK